MTSDTLWHTYAFGDVAKESTERLGADRHAVRVFGVDRHAGLTPEAKYSATDVSRYKVIGPGMFAYNPMRLNIGSIAYCSEGDGAGVVSPDYVVFGCCDDRLYHGFLKYFINGSEWRNWTTKAGVGSVRVRIYFRELARMLLRLPPLPEQKRIAHILGTLDDKIELNRRMNATLEAMSRAIFKSWFVEAVSGACRRSVADLATDGVLQVGDGYRAKNSELGAVGLPFARAGNIDNGFSFVDVDHLLPDSVAKAGDKLSQSYDVVFTSKGTVGRFAFVPPSMSTFVYSPQLCYWRSADHSRLNPFVLYQWMQSREFLDQVDRVKGQTDMAEYVSLRDQRRMELSIPDSTAQAHIAPQLEALQGKLWGNIAESRTLAALRDSLLPSLLSGEVRVPEAESLFEEAVR